MSYNYLNFLRPIFPNSRNIQIIDRNNEIKFTVNPYFILSPLVNNNVVRINLKNGKTILLDFNNSTEAKSALESLQEQIDILTQKTPIVIEKNVENFIEDIEVLTPSNGVLYVHGDLLPGTTSTYNIGSPQYEWHTLYVGSQSLVVGGVTVSSSNGSLNISSINLGTNQNPLLLTASGSSLFLNGTELYRTNTH